MRPLSNIWIAQMRGSSAARPVEPSPRTALSWRLYPKVDLYLERDLVAPLFSSLHPKENMFNQVRYIKMSLK